MSKGTAITWAQRLFLAALVAALLVFGLSATGSTASQLAFADGSAWLPTWELGEAVQVNSASGEVTARTKVSEPGRKTEIIQLGSNAAVLNVSTGEFGAVNGASLTYAPTGTAPKTSTLVGGNGTAYVVDPASKTVRPVDANTVALGDSNSIPAGPYSMASASDGSLWIASIGSRQVVAAQGDRVSTPRQVAPEGNTIALATVEKTPVILDLDDLTAIALDRTTSAPRTSVCLSADPIPYEGLQFAGSDHLGETALTAVLSARDGDLLISDFKTETCARVPVGSLDQEYGPILVHHDSVFIPNWTEGKIVVVDAAKRVVRYTAQVAAAGSPLDLFVDDDQVWFNNPAGPEAGVVDENRIQNRLDKYSGTVLPTGAQVAGDGTISVVAEGEEAGDGSVIVGGDRPIDSVAEGGRSPATPGDNSAPTTTTTLPEQPSNSPDRPLIPEETPDLTVLPEGTLDPNDTSGETSSGPQSAADAPQPAPKPEESEGPIATTTTVPNQLVADFSFTGTGIVTVGDTVVFTDISSGGPETWTWTFGDGSSSAGRTAGKTWSEPGIYDVVLTVTRAFETSQAKASIQVLPPANNDVPQPPVAQIQAARNTAEVGESLTFTDASGGGKPDTVTWDFKDGSTAEGSEVSHAWTTEGQFTVQMTAANAQGSSIATRTVTIVASVQKPTAGIEMSSSSVFTDESVRLTSTSEGDPTNFNWAFGDGETMKGPSVNHSWDEPGRYTVTLNVSNSAGQSEATTQIEVRARTLKPKAKIGVNAASVEVGGTIEFQNQSSNDPTELRWEFGDGETSTDASPTHRWDDEGTYTVKLTASNEAGKDTATVEIKVLPPRDPAPVADFRVRPNRIRTTDTVRFDDRSTNNPTTWSWTFGDGNTSSAANPRHVYAEPGDYDVTLVVSNARDSDSTTKKVTVTGPAIQPPNADFSYDTGRTWRVGDDVPFTAVQAAPAVWQWSFGDGATDTGRAPTHRFTAAGTYTIQLVVQNLAGQEARSAQTIRIEPAADVVPDPTFTFAPTTVVAGLPITFTDTSPEQATLTPPVWTFAAGPNGTVTSGANRSAVWTFAAAQQVTVRMQVCLLTKPSACKTAVQTFDVLPAPTAPIAAFRLAGAAKPPSLGINEAMIVLPLQLIDESTGDGLDDPTSTFIWTIEGRQLAGRTVQTQVTTLGAVPVSLQVTTPYGTNIHTKQITFLSNVPPVAAIAAPPTGVFGQPVTFTDASTGGPTAWVWEFDDGSPVVTTQNVNHVFTTLGQHTVQLTATNHLGTTSVVRQINITLPPLLVPKIGISQGGVAVPPPISIPLGATLVFTDATVVPPFQTATRTWTIADLPGVPLTTPSVSQTWTTPGQKVVTLTVTDQFGRAANASITVTVVAPPTTTTTSTTTTTTIPA